MAADSASSSERERQMQTGQSPSRRPASRIVPQVGQGNEPVLDSVSGFILWRDSFAGLHPGWIAEGSRVLGKREQTAGSLTALPVASPADIQNPKGVSADPSITRRRRPSAGARRRRRGRRGSGWRHLVHVALVRKRCHEAADFVRVHDVGVLGGARLTERRSPGEDAPKSEERLLPDACLCSFGLVELQRLCPSSGGRRDPCERTFPAHSTCISGSCSYRSNTVGMEGPVHSGTSRRSLRNKASRRRPSPQPYFIRQSRCTCFVPPSRHLSGSSGSTGSRNPVSPLESTPRWRSTPAASRLRSPSACPPLG